MRKTIILISLIAFTIWCRAQELAEYSVSAIGTASSGDFAPYMIGSWNHGKTPMKSSALLDADIHRDLDMSKHLSWGFGFEALTGYSHSADYAYWNETLNQWDSHSESPSALWLQQLYGMVKYRCLFLYAGMKEQESKLLNNRLSSGDFVESNNARPIPQIRIGMVDFQDIPYTNGWVQIQCEVSAGKMWDNTYLKDHYNYYNYHLNTDSRYLYRYCYFRTNPEKPFSVTVGMQAGSYYGGTTKYYNDGVCTEIRKCENTTWTFFKVLIPLSNNGEEYKTGSSVGSWDLRTRYRLKNGNELYAYFQGPWEDGSSIGRRNKLDGLWGLEYKSSKRSIVNGAVLEYIDFRDQSGPIHWDPADADGTTLQYQATGRDDYYNNYLYNSYANFGMSIGSPFLAPTLYNLDGYPGYKCTRANGFHAGMLGCLSSTIDYRMLVSYQRGLGTYNVPFYDVRKCTSAMVEGTWAADCLLPGLAMKMQCAIDRGKLRGNNFGMALTISYSGRL